MNKIVGVFIYLNILDTLAEISGNHFQRYSKLSSAALMSTNAAPAFGTVCV